MGHNDQKDRSEGAGPFTSYKSFLERFIKEALEHGATPVLITTVNRLTFDAEGKIHQQSGRLSRRRAAGGKGKERRVIDLDAMSKLFYEALGTQDSHKAFAGNDTTHHKDYGSYELAKCVVQGIKDTELPLAEYLFQMQPFDPAHSDPVAALAITITR
jgi:hypothetical protein